MKKLTIIVILFFLSIFSIGCFFVYGFFLSSYKNAYQSYIKQNKSSSLITKIYINPSELYVNTTKISWEDDNKEVIVDNKLYDIVSSFSEKGKVVLLVISDEQELEIKKQFASTYDLSLTKSNNSPIKLIKQFLSLKFYSGNSNELEISNELQLQSFYNNYYLSIQKIYLQKDTPPPSSLA